MAPCFGIRHEIRYCREIVYFLILIRSFPEKSKMPSLRAVLLVELDVIDSSNAVELIVHCIDGKQHTPLQCQELYSLVPKPARSNQRAFELRMDSKEDKEAFHTSDDPAHMIFQPCLACEVFVHRRLRTDADRHADVGFIEEALEPEEEQKQTAELDRERGPSLPQRHTLQCVGSCVGLLPFKGQSPQSITSADGSGTKIGTIRCLDRSIQIPGLGTKIMIADSDDRFKMAAASFDYIMQKVIDATDRSQEDMKLRIPETNITQLQRRSFSCVNTPFGRVPISIWMAAAVAQIERPQDVARACLHSTDVALSIFKRQQTPMRRKDVFPMVCEVSATAQCLASRHLAYIKDMFRQPDSGQDKYINSDSWGFPWLSPSMRLVEADCEDGAILAYTIADAYLQLWDRLHLAFPFHITLTTPISLPLPTATSNEQHLLAPLATQELMNTLGAETLYLPALAFLTLRPPTDKAGTGWTYHAICMKFHVGWLISRMLESERGSGGNLRYDVWMRELVRFMKDKPHAIVMDTSAVQECVWLDHPTSLDAKVAIRDAAAVPLQARLFAHTRSSWKQVRDAGVYGHIQSIMFDVRHIRRVEPARALALFGYKDTRVVQCELAWQGKLGVPFNDVFMNPDKCFASELVARPHDVLDTALAKAACGQFQKRMPSMPLFRPGSPRQTDSLASAASAKPPWRWLEDVQVAHPATFDKDKPGIAPPPRTTEPSDADVTKGHPSTFAKYEGKDDSAICTMRTEDWNAQVQKAFEAHNPGRKITAKEEIINGKVSVTIVRVS